MRCFFKILVAGLVISPLFLLMLTAAVIVTILSIPVFISGCAEGPTRFVGLPFKFLDWYHDL